MAFESALAILGSQAFAGTAALAGTAVSTYGALYKGQAEAAAAEYNAALLTRNSGLARAQAEADAEDKRREGRRYLGALHAAFGASGLALEGSALDLYEDSALNIELAAQRIEYGGELRAAGLEAEADLQRAKGEAASTAGLLGAAAEIVRGGGSLYLWDQRQQAIERAAWERGTTVHYGEPRLRRR